MPGTPRVETELIRLRTFLHFGQGLISASQGHNYAVIRILGVALLDDDARQLIALLRADGGADSVEAAAAIATALTRQRDT